jgi:hypothetical protein
LQLRAEGVAHEAVVASPVPALERIAHCEVVGLV